MSLAGIAGFLLSIGMAVDANVLIFERTKEELRRGLSRTIAIKEGFKRAWPSIRDSNISTIITALILYNLTSSFVKGLALTLLLGVIVSMFTAITVSRNLMTVFVKDKTEQIMNIIGHKKIFLTLSSILVAVSIVLIAVFGFKPGIDFTGGTLWQLKIDNSQANESVLQNAFVSIGAKDPIVYKELTSETYMVKLHNVSESDHQTYLSRLKKSFLKFRS